MPTRAPKRKRGTLRQFTARFATNAEIASWDDHVIASPGGGNLLQSASFASVKAKHGWKPLYLVYEGTTVLDGAEAPFASYNLVLEKSVPALGKIWYMIKGPGVNSVEEIPAILDANKDFIKREKLGVFAVKIEPDIRYTRRSRQSHPDRPHFLAF